MTTAQIATLAKSPNYVPPVTPHQLGAMCAADGDNFCPEEYYIPGSRNYLAFIAGFQTVRPNVLAEIALPGGAI